MQVGTVCSIGSVVLKLHRYQIVPKQTKDMEHYELTKSFQFYNFTKKLMMSSFPSFSSFFLKLNCVSCMYILDIIYLLGILPLTICLKIVPLDIQAIMCQKRGSFPHEFKIDTKCLEKTPQNMSLSLFTAQFLFILSHHADNLLFTDMDTIIKSHLSSSSSGPGLYQQYTKSIELCFEFSNM